MNLFHTWQLKRHQVCARTLNHLKRCLHRFRNTGAAVFPKECSWYAECQVSQLGSACVHHPLFADNRIKSAKSIVQIINPPGH